MGKEGVGHKRLHVKRQTQQKIIQIEMTISCDNQNYTIYFLIFLIIFLTSKRNLLK